MNIEGLEQGKELMDKALEHLSASFSHLRVGRASIVMLDGIKVEAYGSGMSLKEVATLSTPDARTIAIQPWDTSLIGAIEKVLLAANLGMTPMNDGKIIRMNLPPMTEERRKEFVKDIKKLGEDAKVSIRNTRRLVIEAVKKSDASEDDQHRQQDETQKITDDFIKKIETLVEKKSEEVMSV